jgi:hypothetical protein
MKVNSSDLQYKYSKTVTGDDSAKFRGKPDSSEFNRHEEYEVIPMIEHIMNHKSWSQKASIHKIEDLIKKIPSNTRRRDHVFDWLVANL